MAQSSRGHKAPLSLLNAEFGTSDTDQQIAILRGLSQAARTPVIALAVMLDPRTDSLFISPIGPSVPAEVAIEMLMRAQREITDRERSVLREQLKQASPGEGTQAPIGGEPNTPPHTNGTKPPDDEPNIGETTKLTGGPAEGAE